MSGCRFPKAEPFVAVRRRRNVLGAFLWAKREAVGFYFLIAPATSKERASMGNARLHRGERTIPQSCHFVVIHLPLHKGGKGGGEVRYNPDVNRSIYEESLWILPIVRLKNFTAAFAFPSGGRGTALAVDEV